MAIGITVPVLGESVVEATIARWIKKSGDAVAADEPVVELETDKVTLEVPAPVNGTLTDIIAAEGATVEVGALLAMMEEGAAPAKAEAPKAEAPKAEASAPAPAAPAPATPAPAAASSSHPLSPAVRRLVEENNLNPAAIPATGKDGRLTKGDVQDAIAKALARQRLWPRPHQLLLPRAKMMHVKSVSQCHVCAV